MFQCLFFFFKQNTAYEMRISDWSSDVCSSDLIRLPLTPELSDDRGLPRILVPDDHEAHAKDRLILVQPLVKKLQERLRALSENIRRHVDNMVTLKRSEERRVGKE